MRDIRIPCMFPDAIDNVYWIYLLGKEDGVIKIGRTRYPRLRVRNHLPFQWVHLLGRGSYFFGTRGETKCIAALSTVIRRVGRTEQFTGELTREEAIAICRAALAATRVEERGVMKQLAASVAQAQAWHAFKKQYVTA